MGSRNDQDLLDHVPAMRRYARALSRGHEAADDLVHDALVRAYEGAAGFRPQGSLKHWLLAIVRNCFLSGLRRHKAEAARHEAFALMRGEHVEAGQEQRAYLGQIAQRFADLPDHQRETLYLVTIEGLDYHEAAQLLGVPIGTVMSRLSRARAGLRAIEAAAETHAIGSLRIVGGRDAG